MSSAEPSNSAAKSEGVNDDTHKEIEHEKGTDDDEEEENRRQVTSAIDACV